jgi:alanine racemase
MLKIQINLRTIQQNLFEIKRTLPEQTKICAVIKANAYGFGDIKMAELLEKAVDCFGVATVMEGKRLRTAGITKDILVFGVCDDILTAIENNLIITVNSIDEIRNIIETKKEIRIHIAVDTGMNRFGIKDFADFKSVILLLKANKKIAPEGIYTHFAFEDNCPRQIDIQIKVFQKFIAVFKRHFPSAIVHGASSGTVRHSTAIFDMVRIGKALYGGIDGMETAITVKSKIIAVKRLREGEQISYNGEWTADKPTAVGIVSGGYADGIDMRFTGHSFVMVKNKMCKIVGRICMDCFAIILPNDKITTGETVSIISNRNGQTLMDIYRETGIIVCNILCGIKHTRAKITYLE